MEYETTIMVFKFPPSEQYQSPSLTALFTKESGVITVPV